MGGLTCTDACCDLGAARLLLQRIADIIADVGAIHSNDPIVAELKSVTR